MQTWHITIDQFGYRPGDEKVAVIANPQAGFNAHENFVPGSTYQVRRVANSEVVFSAAPTVWNGGQTDPLSGDKAWWFDFSAVSEPGAYFIYDLENRRASYDFVINENVYERVLYHALRIFYYQRLAIAHEAPFAEYPWYDEAAWLQDRHARDVFAPDDTSRIRDVSGGWMDAGDSNKYITFIDAGLHELLAMYQSKPAFFKDFCLNIPESHLDAPDILSEIKWELDWFLKMQNADGSAHIKCGVRTENPYRGPDAHNRDTFVRYYNGHKSSAAAVAIAGVFAHAAIVYADIPLYKDYAALLGEKAALSWQWYTNNPRNEKVDGGEIHAGIANRTLAEQDSMAMTAAMYLFMLTGRDEYHRYVKENIRAVAPFNDTTRDGPQIGADFHDYMKHPAADPQIVTLLREKYTELAKRDDVHAPLTFRAEDNAYRAYLREDAFWWGHLRMRCFAGYDAFLCAESNLLPEQSANFKNRAINHLHHIHGVNPFAMTFLTNMYPAGASKSCRYLFHEWFMTLNGTGVHSPPGYLVGGPNRYNEDLNQQKLSPPLNQPPMKAYLDAPHYIEQYGAYGYTEPMCAYQCSYVRLLACFVG